MKTKTTIPIVATGLVALVLGLGLGHLLSSGDSDAANGGHDHAAAGTAVPEATVWTCSMHPQIRQSGPGDCPICGMDLIPLAENDDSAQGPRTLAMSDASRALAEIQTVVVERRYPEAQVRIVGGLDFDQTRVRSLSARFPARINRLYVNYTGIRVQRGEHLADVYSPELLSAQRELLTAYHSDPDSSITAASREKLRLWDLLPEQIDSIIERGEPRDNFELRAPTGGVVVTKNVNEGDYVQTGQSLFKIVDLDVLWLNLEAYESDLPWLRYGQQVEFSVETYPGETFTGQIAFIEPELNRNTRTVPVRVNVPNPNARLKPGMFARGIVDVRVAQGGRVYAPEMSGKWISPMHPEIVKDGPGQCDVCGMDLVPAEELGYVDAEALEAPIVVPTSAVLRTGKRAVVYVRDAQADRPTFEGREIVLGPRAGDVFVVESGLEPGDEVVTKGAFKIDSALQIQAKPSMMNPEGGGPAPGHDHDGAAPAGGETMPDADDDAHEGHSSESGAPELSIAETKQLLDPYFALQAALAGDDLAGAKEAINAMSEATGHASGVGEVVHAMLAAESLDGIRRPYFEVISNALVSAIRGDEEAFAGTIHLMHCPMVYPDRGADWLQASDDLKNPYFGSSMLTCGEVREVLGGVQ